MREGDRERETERQREREINLNLKEGRCLIWSRRPHTHPDVLDTEVPGGHADVLTPVFAEGEAHVTRADLV